MERQGRLRRNPDHGDLTGLADDDHPQYIKDSEFTQDSGFLVGTGAGTFQEETGNTARTSLGLGTGDSPTFTGLTISTTGEINFRDTDISIGSTLFDGILDMSADISIDMFYDNADVGDGVDGQSLNINRRAGEGDDYISLYVDKDRKGLIGFSGDDDLLQLTANALTVNGTVTAAGLTITGNSVFGLNSSVFQPTTDSTTFFQVLDADGGTPLLNIDTTDERVIIGGDTPVIVGNLKKAIFSVYSPETDGTALFAARAPTDQQANFILQANANFRVSSPIFKGERSRDTAASPAVVQDTDVLFSLIGAGWDGSSYKFAANIDIEAAGTFTGSSRPSRILLRTMAVGSTTIKTRLAVDSSGNIGIGKGNTDSGESSPETLTEWTDTNPYLTLHNSTHEDTDGGRESRFNFKGEQSGGEETTLARMEIGHDGAADDEKGKIVLSTNDGSDADTPTDHVKIDAAGNIYLGDLGGTNQTVIETDGTIRFDGAATVFNDLVVPLSSARVPAANAPSWDSFVGNLNAYTYDLNDFQEFSTELAHSYKNATLIEFHIHGAVNGSNVDERTIKFEIEYSIADVPAEDGFGDVFPATTTINAELTIPALTTDLTGFTLDIGDDTSGSFIQGAIVKGRLRRIASTGTEPTSDPFLTEVGLHIESDTIGTRTSTAK